VIVRLAQILAPIFIAVLVGWALKRSGRSYPADTIGVLVADVGAPCLVFHALVSLEVSGHTLEAVALASSLAILIFMVLGYLVLRVCGWPTNTFLPPIMFSNCGNLGIPLGLYAFGVQGEGLAVAVFAVFCAWQFSLGIWIWSGELSPRTLLRSPITAAAVLGVLCAMTDTAVPVWILNTAELLGGLTIPLMLITLGVSLASMRIHNLTRSLVISALRLLVGPLVGLMVSRLFGLEGMARAVLILQCAMPSAVFNYLLAQRYERAADDVASVIVVGTVASLLTLPLLLAWLL